MVLPAHWFGDVESLWHLIDSRRRFLEDPSKFSRRHYGVGDEEDYDEAEEEDPVDEYIQVEDGVGILTVEGSIASTEQWYHRYFGVVSYPMISRGVLKLVRMYQAGEIHDIVLAIDSSGGAVDGISGLSDSIRLARRITPRIWAWTGTKALSAGYWIASSCSKVYMAQTAEVGSIGVISVARSMKRYFEELGIDNTVVRSGQYKALATPYETLSPEAEAEIQEKSDTLHGFFQSHVLAMRPQLDSANRARWGTGKTFFAEQAIELGMADDRPMPLSELVNELSASHRARLTRQSAPSGYGEGESTYSSDRSPAETVIGAGMAKQVVFPTEEARAAASLGVALETLPHREIDVQDPPAGAAPAQGEKPAQSAASALGEARSENGPLETLLREQTAQVVTLSAKNAQLEDQLARAQAEVGELRTAAQAAERCLTDAVGRLQIASGFRPADLSGLPLATLTGMYSSAKAEFEKRMPAGRLTQAPVEDSSKANAAADHDPRLARLIPLGK